MIISRYSDIIRYRERGVMPTLARFNGVVVRMFFLAAEHNPPHVHVYCVDQAAAIDIKTRQLIDGSIPQREAALAREWIAANEAALLEIWETQQFKKLGPLL